MSFVVVRAADRGDADAMAALINEIIAIGGTTAHRDPFDAARIVDVFIAPKRAIACVVAVDGAGGIVGFQALEWSDPDWPGAHRLPPDWAAIASFVAPSVHGRGVGRALFAETRFAAKAAGVAFINATIRRENVGGLAFYDKLGFVDYRSTPAAISKRLAPD